MACAASLVCRRREHEVAGLGDGQRELDRLEVTHLTDEDDVGVFSQRGTERMLERVGVGTDLALVDRRTLVTVHVLDRVFDREDVAGAVVVDVVDDRRERRRLPGTGRTGHEHEPLRQSREVRDARGQSELLEARDVVRDDAEAHRELTLAVVHVATEAAVVAPGEREVDFLLLAHLGNEFGPDRRLDQRRRIGVAVARRVLDLDEVPVDPHPRLTAAGDQQVGCAVVPQHVEVLVDRGDVDGVHDLGSPFRTSSTSMDQVWARLSVQVATTGAPVPSPVQYLLELPICASLGSAA